MKKREDITKDILKQMILIDGKKQRDVAKHFGVSEACISKKLKEFGIRKTAKDRYVGKSFGQLVVTKIKGYDQHSHAILECVCDCGKTVEVVNHALTSGNTKSCGCTARKVGQDHHLYKGYKSLTKQMWNSLEHGARKRNLEVGITMEYAWNLYEKQGRRCALSGEPIFFARTAKSRTQTTASLDRIDSSVGYIEGNVQWVHKNINVMKWDFTQEEFLKMCHKVVAYLK